VDTPPERPLSDVAIVVRGGLMASETLQVNAEAHTLEHPGEWAISVASAEGLDVAELVHRSPWIRNNTIRVASVGAVRALGHDVVPSGEFPHADLILGSEPSEAIWEELRQAFDDPIRKPGIS
jgi:hypothetical protein